MSCQCYEVMNSASPQSFAADETEFRAPKTPLPTRRSFLKTTAVFVGGVPLWVGRVAAQSGGKKPLLMAYVGTFSSPLRDVLPTQVDLPPGNGRGIHCFQADRSSGVLTP